MQIRAHHSTGRLRKVTDNLSIIHLPWVSGGSMAAGPQSSCIAGTAKSMFNSSPMHFSAFPNGDLFSSDSVANQLLLIVNYVHSLSMTTCLWIPLASKTVWYTCGIWTSLEGFRIIEGLLVSWDSSLSDCFTTSSFPVMSSTTKQAKMENLSMVEWRSRNTRHMHRVLLLFLLPAVLTSHFNTLIKIYIICNKSVKSVLRKKASYG